MNIDIFEGRCFSFVSFVLNICFYSFLLCMSVFEYIFFAVIFEGSIKHFYFITSRIYVSLPFHLSHQW